MSGAVAMLGLGVAAPGGHFTQETAARFSVARCPGGEREQTWLRRIHAASGVNTRASVLVDSGNDLAALEAFYGLPADPEDRGPTTAMRLRHYAAEAPALGEKVCARAFADAGIEPAEVTHVVTVSCTGLMSPDLGEQLIARLHLGPDVGRLNLGFMGCHGALNGMRAAQAFVQSDPDACVLVCCVELCSLHFQYGRNRQRLVANALFADGAGAAIFAREQRSRMHLEGTASLVLPDSGQEMTWVIGDHGFEMGLSPKVPVLIRERLRGWLKAWLAERGMGLEDIAHWAIHPGGPKIVRAVAEALDLSGRDTAASLAVLAEHGNMSSPTVLFVLDRLRAGNAGGRCVALGFGPGLVFEAALLDFA